MGDAAPDLPLSLPLVAYRVAQAELVQRAMQVELHDIRKEMGKFVLREDVQRAATVRREWPVILATLVMAGTSIANVVLIASH